MANGTITTSGTGPQFGDTNQGGPLQDEINTAATAPIAFVERSIMGALDQPMQESTPETGNLDTGVIGTEELSMPDQNLRQSTASQMDIQSPARSVFNMLGNSDRTTGGGGSFGEASNQENQLDSQDVSEMSSPINRIFPEMNSPADRVAGEPNVERTLDAGQVSEAISTNLPPQAQRDDDIGRTLSNVEQQARGLLQNLNDRSAVDMSPMSRPVRETEEQRQMIEQSDDPDTLRQRMDDIREQYNLPELEKQSIEISNAMQSVNESFNQAIQEIDDSGEIFGELERQRIKGLADQRDARLSRLNTARQALTQQIDSINTRVNQEVQAEQVAQDERQQQRQETRQRVGNLIETGALANMSDQELISVSEQSGYTPETLARIRQSQQQSLQQVDASGTAGEFQDLKRMGAIADDVSYQQFLQMSNQGSGGSSAAIFQQEFSRAERFAQNNIGTMSPQQIINRINQGTTELNRGEIQDIVTVAQQNASPEARTRQFMRQIQSVATDYRSRGITDTDEASELVLRDYASEHGFDDTDDIPENIQNFITNVTKRVYGEGQTEQ